MSFSDLEFVPTKHGNLLALYQGHTFTRMTSKTRWYCSRKTRGGCKAILVTTEDRQFREFLNAHNHPAPNLFKTTTGEVVRI